MIDQKQNREIPEIIDEEDKSFGSSSPDTTLGAEDNLDKEITKFRYFTGRNIIYTSMLAMIVLVAADCTISSFGLSNNLVDNAFETFKLITMTVLGYMFGSNVSKK
ncbi:MAG: hypothetical protein HFE30_05025 [Clostridiales bacterium]|nr:hypothetical protein [Clostridiales bacterium]